jgi:4-amino-4-deoxy-L-arabinose transferase-like glycosyltransferase
MQARRKKPTDPPQKTLLALIFAAIGLGLAIRLDQAPPIWFDEGWILSVAKNWATIGHYGQLKQDMPISASMLNIGLPAIAPITLFFRVFGVGIWQGRLLSALTTLGSIYLIYQIARKLYSERIATGTLFTLLFLHLGVSIHPLIVGRQALGEAPALFYLLMGYWCCLKALQRSRWGLLPTCIFWGLALATKLQILPFLLTALVIPACIAARKRQWHLATRLVLSSVGSMLIFVLVRQLQSELLHDDILPQARSGLYSVTAIVLVMTVRLAALRTALLLVLPVMLGLSYSLMRWGRDERFSNDPPLVAIRQSLAVFSASWIIWYIVLSVGWSRYLFIPAFMGSPFATLFLHDATSGFSIPYSVTNASSLLMRLKFNRRNLASLIAVMLMTLVPLTIYNLFGVFRHTDSTTVRVADFLDQQTAPDSLIETYDMELFVFLERSYHYPPDQIQIELNRRTFLGQDIAIDYDPLEADPDYLVVGPFSRMWRLYEPVLQTGAFSPVNQVGQYAIYIRVREPR